MALPLDESQLLAAGLCKVNYYELDCPKCGVWRVGIPPGNRPTLCLICQDGNCHVTSLTRFGRCWTKHPLPVVEKMQEENIPERNPHWGYLGTFGGYSGITRRLTAPHIETSQT